MYNMGPNESKVSYNGDDRSFIITWMRPDVWKDRINDWIYNLGHGQQWRESNLATFFTMDSDRARDTEGQHDTDSETLELDQLPLAVSHSLIEVTWYRTWRLIVIPRTRRSSTRRRAPDLCSQLPIMSKIIYSITLSIIRPSDPYASPSPTRQRLRFVGSQLFKFPQLSSFCSYSPTIVTVGDLARAIDKLGFKTTGNRIDIALPLTPKQLYKFRLWTRRTDRYDTGRQLCWYSCLVSAEVE